MPYPRSDPFPSSARGVLLDSGAGGEDLPPTLLPGAIFHAVPPRRKRLSVLITLNVYGLMGLSAMAWVQHREAAGRRFPPTPQQVVTLTFEDVSEPPPPAVVPSVQGGPPSPEAPEGTNTIDPRLLALDPVLPMEAMTAEVREIPTTLPREAKVIGDTHLPVAAGGTGLASGDSHGHGHGSGRGTGQGIIRGVPGMNPGLDLDDLEVIHEEIPEYPTLAAWSNIQGDVVVRVTIDERGVPIRTELLEGPPPLCKETMWAAKLWRFGKGIFRGRKVNATFDMTFRYILHPK